MEVQNDFERLEKGGFCLKEIRAFDSTFFLVKVIDNDLVYQWTYLYGFSEECVKFKYEITCNFKNGERLNYHGEVQSLSMSHKDVMEEGNVLIMPKKKTKSVQSYQISLKNLKEEAKDDDSESGISDNEESKNSE